MNCVAELNARKKKYTNEGEMSFSKGGGGNSILVLVFARNKVAPRDGKEHFHSC